MPEITVVSEEAVPVMEEIKVSQNEEDPDGWERVSYGDLNIGGMDDPFANKFKSRISEHRKVSPYALKYESWTLKSVIVKANDDLRQEVLAIQLMRRLQQIFETNHIPIYLRPYEIFVTSSNSGLLEFVPDTNSVDYLKKKFPKTDWTLKNFYE